MISILVPNKQEDNIVKTLMVLEETFPFAQIIIATDRYGHGKGWAIREALAEAKFDIICFIDGDMDIEPRMIWRLMPFLEDYDIVVGTKAIKGLASRRWLTRASRMYIWMVFGLKMQTQVGLKMFKRAALLPWKTNSYAFDVEILYNAKKAGFPIIEVPVETNITRKMKVSSILNSLIESLKLRWRIK